VEGSHRPAARPSSPNRANQASKLGHVPRSLDPVFLGRFPPPPSVEDELESLAKEHGADEMPGSWDDEPKYRGDVDQYPIIQPVEQGRFVLLSQNAPADDELSEPDDTESATRQPAEYQANTGRKYRAPQPDEQTPARTPQIRRQKSHVDLPPIETDFGSRRREGAHRAKSATHVNQRPQDSFDLPDGERPSDGFLSPSIIKHATKGRERAYFDFNPGPEGPDTRPTSNRRRDSDRHERTTLSAVSNGRRGADSAVKPTTSRRDSEKYSRRDESTASRSRNSPPRREEAALSPPRDRDGLQRNPSYRRKRDPTSREEDGYSSGDQSKGIRRTKSTRRTSVVYQDRSQFLSPATAPTRNRSKSRPTTPLASPRLPDDESISPSRAPMSFPPPRGYRRQTDPLDSPHSSGSSPPRNASRTRENGPNGPRPHARAPSLVSSTSAPVAAAAAAAILPMAIPILSGSPPERRRPGMPPPSSRHGSLEPSPPKAPWQPPRFVPPPNGPVSSFRRYSEDVRQGAAPGLPQCWREVPQAGFHDWLTLPGCDNFHVCPPCYQSVFFNTDFRTRFVPAPFRSQDRKVACDIGSSHWHRIGWFMTQKLQLPDLRLLKGVADATAKRTPCDGDVRTTRVWYSVRDPLHYNSPVPDFSVCSSCTKAVESLFPNLVGALQASEGKSRGVCSLHFYPNRKRFLEYFDLLEAASELALSTRAPPDLKNLADGLRRVSFVEECPRDTDCDRRKWFLMQSLPTFTVCEECYEDVVLPEVTANNAIACNFYRRPEVLPKGACQLYSQRMRDIFAEACQTNGLNFLKAKVSERQQIEARIHAKLRRYEDVSRDRVDAEEVKKLVEEWKRWE